MDDENGKEAKPTQRLCNEIQLFDLCDLDACSYKEGRYCTNQGLIERFEAIAEDDGRQADRYQDADQDDSDGDEEALYGSGLDDDGYDDGGWEDE